MRSLFKIILILIKIYNKEIEIQSRKNNKKPMPAARRRCGESFSNKKSSYDYEMRDVDGDGDVSEGAWPPKKYEHIKSTGYGTSWSPASFKKSPKDGAMDGGNDSKKRRPFSANTRTNRSTSRSKSETRSVNRDLGNYNYNTNKYSNESMYYSSKGSLHGGESGGAMNREKYFAQISDLKSENSFSKIF